MSYRWVVASGRAAEVELLDQRFDDQGGAEAWLTAFYEDLADAGVSAVSLYEEDRLVYGPMSLEA